MLADIIDGDDDNGAKYVHFTEFSSPQNSIMKKESKTDLSIQSEDSAVETDPE